MSLQYEESVLDFDIDFFHQSFQKELTPEKLKEKNGKCRTAINVAKKKIVATDSLIRKYYEKKDELEQLEKALYTSKEECRKACIEFQNVTDRYNKLDNEAQILRNINQQLQHKCIQAENRVDAIQSHAHQLQTLVKENETVIEGMKVEKHLEKASIKDYEKNISSFQKENNLLMKHICLAKDVIFGKRKLNKRFKDILEKYNKSYESDDNDSVLGEVDSEDDNYSNLESPAISEDTYKEEILTSPVITLVPSQEGGAYRLTSHLAKIINLATQKHVTNFASKLENAGTKIDNYLDSDFSNEHTSADTGRGSSLAFSDSDKCFHSPDYFMEHSPIDTNIAKKNKIKLVDVATSPIPSHVIVDTATSPIPFKETVHSEESPKEACTEKEIISISKLIPETRQPNPNELCVTPNDGIIDETVNEYTTENISNGLITSVPTECNQRCEKECLEMNNSDNLNERDNGDCEIELILSNMRLTHELITPLPITPSKSQHCTYSRTSVTKEHDPYMQSFVCKDALKVKEENISLRANIIKLANEIESIKDMLKNKHFPHQQHPTTESDDEDLIYIPEEVNNHNSAILETSQLKTDLIPKQENQLTKTAVVHNPDLRKGIKRLEFEEPLLSVENDLPDQTVHETELKTQNLCESSNTDNGENIFLRKPYKQRKLTKLEKFRKKLVPKNKIKANLTPIRKMKNKHILLPKMPSIVTAALDNKNAYEKAVKIISELKSMPKEKKLNRISTIVYTGEQNIKEKDILLNIPELQLNENEQKTAVAVPSKGESTKDIIAQSLENQQKISQQNSKRVVILENILLTNADKILENNEPPQNFVESKLNDNLSASNLLKNEIPSKIETLTNLPQSKPIQKEEKERFISNFEEQQMQYCEETETTVKDKLYMERTEIVKRRREDIKDYSNFNINCKDQFKKTELTEFAIPIAETKVSFSPRKLIATRSRTKILENLSPTKDTNIDNKLKSESCPHKEIDSDINTKCSLQQRLRKRQKRTSDDNHDIECKRMLRSSTSRISLSHENKTEFSNQIAQSERSDNIMCINTEEKSKISFIAKEQNQVKKNIVSYNDIDTFSEFTGPHGAHEKDINKPSRVHPKDSILCAMLDKYGKKSTKNFSKKLPDNIINTINKTIEYEITAIVDSPSKDSKKHMNKFVETVQKWNYKQFFAGLMQYLKDPQRKIELFNKVSSPPAPPMTKVEQILLYVMTQLKYIWTSINVVDCLLCNIEYVLFKLNRTPEFDTIESMAHFYAITCRYFKMKSRLRLFMLDAMYCIQFKSVPLIKQCFEVWMHVLPLAHMVIAKNPLVTCMVYLLHFYKCEDKFNRVQDIRYILNRKYYFEITEWHEPKIIEMFKTAIKEVRAVPVEMKLLRIALIIIAKRHGPQWCQKNIIKNLLLPIIESDIYPERVKIFCVSILGALLKPYPVDMRVHYEIIMNMLLDMLNQNPSPSMKEAIFTSLIYMSRHNNNRVIQALLTWNPQQVSPEFENIIRDFVIGKSLKMWRNTLSKIHIM